MKNVHDAHTAAPPTPACFPDRLQWAAYLLQCQEQGRSQGQRPFDERGIFRPTFNFCSDCTRAHAEAMALERKCKPSQFRVITLIRVPKRVAA